MMSTLHNELDNAVLQRVVIVLHGLTYQQFRCCGGAEKLFISEESTLCSLTEDQDPKGG